MKSIGDFLSRFNALTPPDDAVKKAVAAAVSEALRVAVSPKAVQVAHGVAFISGSSVMKSAIAINRGKILQSLYEALPKSRETVRDVR